MSPERSSLRIGRRRLGVVAVAWIAAGSVAFLGARALDEPVGAGPVDEAQPIVVGAIVEPGAELTGLPSELPRLALVLNDPPPAEVADLVPEDRIERLTELATSGDPGVLLHLGVAHQSAGDGRAAADAYRRAAAADPDASAPAVGLLMVDAASGSAGLARAAGALEKLAAREPDDQIIAFNRGWLAVYQRDPEVALDAWERTRRIDARTPLGLAAGQLVAAIRRGGDGG